MRTYDETQNFKALVAAMAERLGDFHIHDGHLTDVLRDASAFFAFGCAFVYEADHTGELHLREHYAVYQPSHLPSTLTREILGDERLHSSSTLIYSTSKTPNTTGVNTALGERFREAFHVSSLLIVPVLDTQNNLIGLVGMSDRRTAILLSDEAVRTAQSALRIIANHVALRVYQRQVEFSRAALQSTLDHMGVDIYVNDYDTYEILFANKSMAAPYGGLQNIMGKPCWQALYTDKTGPCSYCPKQHITDEEGNPTKVYSWDYRRPFDGSWFRVFSAAFQWVDGRMAHVVTSVDITENKKNETLIRHMAEFDSLTGLPNRRKLMEDCAAAVQRSHVQGGGLFVVFFDLDNFKAINDTYGHQAGDDVLTGIGKLLQAFPATMGKAYRHGGDEFVLLYENTTREELEQALAELRVALAQPIPAGAGSYSCKACMGVAVYPVDGTDADTLIHSADLLMYTVKRTGKNGVQFSTSKNH